MIRRLFIVSLLCAFVLGAASVAQKNDPSRKHATAPRVLTIADVDDWKSVRQFVLSANGAWAAHTVMPNEGDGKLVISKTDSAGRVAEIESTNDDDEEKSATKSEGGDKDRDSQEQERPSDRYEFVVGQGTGQVRFSHDSRFAAWLKAPLEKASKAAKTSDAAPKKTAVLLSLETGRKTEFKNAQSIAFSGKHSKCLAVHKSKPKGRPSGDEGWDGADLLIHDLVTDAQINVGNVKDFAFNESGKLLSMLIDAEGMAGNGVQLFHVEESRIEILESGQFKYGSMSWTRDGDALALLRAKQDEDYENPHRHLVAFSDVGGSKQKALTLDPIFDAGIPDGMTISPNRIPQWNESRTAVFFGIQELKKKPSIASNDDEDSDEGDEEKRSEVTEDDEDDADLVIWHWEDPRLQSMQQQQESRDKRRFDLCIHLVESTTTIRLADEDIPEVSVGRPFKYAVGRDNRKYELSGNLDGRRLIDLYTIDLSDGKRRLALEAARYVFDVSPDGLSLLYYKDEGDFYVYDMSEGTHTNITADVEASFIDTEDDHNVVNPPRRPVGWTSDSRYVLLSDGWDIWKVSVDGTDAENLTVNGRADQIRYTNPARFDPDVDGVDLSEPVYFSAYGEWTKQAGFARWTPGKTGVELLVWEDASFGRLSKLEDEPIYSFSRSTRQEPTSYHLCGPDLDEPVQLTDLSTQRDKFKWSAGVKLVEYTDSQGNRLQGALHLPANYIEGKKYPTIVYMYEKLSQTANRFDSPRTGGFSAAIYTSNGYAVFNPDIIFQINDPGMASKDCILAGLDAAIESGVVDPERVGLHGHSWGGYQTAFLITQTDRFKAAIAGAPLTNMVSMYSSIYWNSGSANQPIFESSQGRFKGGYWDNLDAYARNSPVYFAEQVQTPLLLLHNDEDGAVDWNQGIEYFNTLRRLGKPVVMLQYVGENHGVRKPENRKDYSYRMFDFFNYHLKDSRPPEWWMDGIKHLEMEEHIKDYRKQKTAPSDK